MPIQGIVHRRARVFFENYEKTLFSIFNGDLKDFRADHVKWFEIRAETIAAKHYHPYSVEVFCMISGCAIFDLVDVSHPEEMESYEVKRGDILLVPKMVAHRVHYQAGSIVVVCNDKPYSSPEHDDMPFDFSALVAKARHRLPCECFRKS